MPKHDWFHWIQDPSLRAAADLILNGGRLPPRDARHAISDLQEESAIHIRAKVGDAFYNQYFPTRRHGGAWLEENPIGVVDHYTAGVRGQFALKWFSSRERAKGISNSSAHYVIDRSGIFMQLINPVDNISWHARSHSYTHIGIEHVNAGLLRKVGASFRYQNTRVYPTNRVDRVQTIEEEHWEPYTVKQIVANIVLKRWLHMAIPTLNQNKFIDHEMADPARKRDCGPLWPLHAINRLVFSDKPIRDMMWMDAEYLSQVGVYEFHREVHEYLSDL